MTDARQQLPSRDRALLRHYLGAVAYRTQKALRGAPPHYPSSSPGTRRVGRGWEAKVARFHDVLGALDRVLADESLGSELTTEQFLQGPLADVMTHVGQLAYLRRLADAPVPPENFIFADVQAGRVGADQPPPARPDAHWPERPASGGGDPPQHRRRARGGHRGGQD